MPYLDNAYCPACGQATLFVFSTEDVRTCQIVCDNSALCPYPQMAQRLLEDPEVEHIVKIEQAGHDTDFVVKHPLRERIEGDGDLFNCSLLKEICEGPWFRGDGDEFLPFGTYRVIHLSDHSWAWESLP